MKMKVVREICVAGPVIEVIIKSSMSNHKAKRKARTNVTSELVQKNNDKIAVRKLTRLINANFGRDSWHVALTYEESVSPEEAQKELKKFIARMRRACRKQGIEFRWIAVTEYENVRIHHHFITNAPLDLIESQWKNGHALPRPFDKRKNHAKLAAYLIKETSKTFRKEDSPCKSRYSHSRNLYIPEVRVERVSDKQLFEEPKAFKGYYIDQDSVRKYEHPVTGLPHLEYQMISLTEEPRIKKYYKGKIKTREEDLKKYINYIEEQLSLL